MKKVKKTDLEKALTKIERAIADLRKAVMDINVVAQDKKQCDFCDEPYFSDDDLLNAELELQFGDYVDDDD